MTTEEAVYIVEQWVPIKDRGLTNKTIDVWYETERILRGWTKPQHRGCKCEYKALSRMVHSFYSQYESEINELYNGFKG